ncbi:MAG TPA: GMC family oxidoreductase N-terminal domain-containing protein [Acetobacteraceae bacterium]|jgi:choline dehydrogenase|nr:GMC family oxidoreductase N-terminal domain-containing protein [Acetobacteraceae bacterium]
MENLAGDTFDYVIVGSGAAGSVLANRLTEQPGVTVCVLEAGPPDRHPYIHVPAGFIKMLFNPDYTWQFKTEPSEGSGGRPIPTTQGRTLGGSSSINGMVYNRGQRADLDSWAQRGNRGWGYVDMLPYYKRTERRIGIADDRIHGRDGNLPVTTMDWFHPICEAFMNGAVGMGIPRCADYNSGDNQAGVGYFQRAIHRGWRHSAARVFLHPAKATGRLDIRTNARAAAVLFEGKRAVGVRYVHDRDRTEHVVQARREIILSCGTANTAKLLQISGIGPASLLGSIGVPVVHDLRGVGENFRDHYSVRVVAKVRNSITINEMSRGMGLAGQIVRWAMGRPSILAVTPSLVHWFWKSDESMDQPDMQGVFSPASYKQGFVGLLDDYPGMTCGVWQHRPESIGYVRARSADPFEDPIIQPNYLADPMDRRVLIAGMRLARRLLHTPELASYFDSDTLPGPEVTSDDEFLSYARQFGSTAYHLIGTARMGPDTDPTSVVDDQLRVHGMEGLRVADASIMPSMPSANTYATTMMIAEKASDMIRGRQPLEPVEGIAA